MSENNINVPPTNAADRMLNPSPAVLDTMIRIIMTQTEMTRDDVISALQRTNYDLKRVIREYMTGLPTESSTTTTSTSTNQLRFSEIRNFMDKSVETFRRNQEISRIYQEVMERKRKQAVAAAAAAAATAAASGSESADADADAAVPTVARESKL